MLLEYNEHILLLLIFGNVRHDKITILSLKQQGKGSYDHAWWRG